MQELISVDASLGAAHHLERPVFANNYAIAGRFISVESADAAATDLFRHYFTGWHISPVHVEDHRRPDATIVVRTGKSPSAPSHVDLFEVAEGGVCRTDANTYFFENDGFVVSAGKDNPVRVEVWIAQ